MTLAAADRKKLVPLLEDLARAVESLLLAGLTTASQATREKFDVSFREASRLGLLRLGSTLRAANEEIGRYLAHAPEFSAKRLAFFLNRAWLLARGMALALEDGDQAAFDRLALASRPEPVKRLEVVCLGVGKKHVAGQYSAFEFRLRVTGGSKGVAAGQRLAWSCVFPHKPGADFAPEAYLQLPQKQQWKPVVLLEKRTVVFEEVLVARDRLTLADGSKVSAGKPFDGWDGFASWDPGTALERLRAHEPGPLDLEIELQEEVVLGEWVVSKDGIVHRGVPFEVAGGDLAKPLAAAAKRKDRPPLYGLAHYERARVVFQPLSLLAGSGPEYLTISDVEIDPKQLLKTLRLT